METRAKTLFPTWTDERERDYEFIRGDLTKKDFVDDLTSNVDGVIQAAALIYGVGGFHKFHADILSKESHLAKNISQGDYLFIDKVGAYGSAMSSCYNSKDLASEILVKDEKFYEIKKRIKTEDLTKFESIAPWLRKN